MHTTLVLNVGSSSVKFAVAQNRRIVVRGTIDHLGREAGIRLIAQRTWLSRTARVPNLTAALTVIRQAVRDLGIVPDLVAHRVVHGGRYFSKPTRLTLPTLQRIQRLSDLAPLHQPANLLGISFARRAWPKASSWAVFDTAIFRSLPEVVRTYAIPRTLAKKLSIEKYGFHGISHAWAFQQAAHQMQKPKTKFSCVTIHLGSGASMTLWKNGKPVDTSMGFTPLEGLVMATRSGDLDPSIPLFIQQQLGWPSHRVHDLLEHRSGIIGLCGFSDMRDLLSAAGHPVPRWPKRPYSATARAQATRALDIYIHRIRHYLAAYLGVSERVNAIVFTGPVGGNPVVQRLVLKDLPARRGIRKLTVHADEEQAIVNALKR